MRFVPPCTNCSPVCECSTFVYDYRTEVTKYSFSSGSLSNDDCGYCDDWEGSFDLCWVAGQRWDSPVSTSTRCGHTSGQPLWRLLKTGGYVTLTMLGPGHQWRILESSWIRGGTNTLTLSPTVITPNPCTVPATITLTPCTDLCGVCSGGSPASVTFDLGNLPTTNIQSCNYDILEGVYVIPRDVTMDCYWRLLYYEACSYEHSKAAAVMSFYTGLEGGVAYLAAQVHFAVSYGVPPGNYDSYDFAWKRLFTGPTFDCTAEYVMGTSDQWARWGYSSTWVPAAWPTLTIN